jgi:amino acid transporter
VGANSEANAKSSLNAESLSPIESFAQTIGGMAPSAGLAVVIPLVYAKAGNASWLMFIPMLVGFLLLAFVFRIFATRTASAGGLGAYGELAFGKWGGIIISWTYIIALMSSIANGAPAAAYYIELLFQKFGAGVPSPCWNVVLMIAVVSAAIIVAYRGIKLSTDVMLAMECISLGGMMVLICYGLIREPHLVDKTQFKFDHLSAQNVQLAIIVAFMSLSGFETVTALGEEAKRPTHTIPKVILYCIVPVGVFYVLATYSLVLIFHKSPVALDQTDAPFQVLADVLHVTWLGDLVSMGVLLSCFALVLGCLNACSRILYDLSKKGNFWPQYSHTNDISSSPYASIFLLGSIGLAVPLVVLSLGVSLVDCIAYLTQLASFAYIACYISISISAPVFLWRIGALKVRDFCLAASALLILGTAAFFNCYPVPPWPWNVVPYLFFGAVVIGIVSTIIYRFLATAGLQRAISSRNLHRS